MLCFRVAMLRAMLRLFSRKLLILKQCYVLRFFENECGSSQRQRKADSANRSTIYSRKATHTILKIFHLYNITYFFFSNPLISLGFFRFSFVTLLVLKT
jgi:hypothetical protein